jgi:hypothetical protein
MWLIFLFGSLLVISVIIISLIIHFINIMGNGSRYPGLEDVT